MLIKSGAGISLSDIFSPRLESIMTDPALPTGQLARVIAMAQRITEIMKNATPAVWEVFNFDPLYNPILNTIHFDIDLDHANSTLASMTAAGVSPAELDAAKRDLSASLYAKFGEDGSHGITGRAGSLASTVKAFRTAAANGSQDLFPQLEKTRETALMDCASIEGGKNHVQRFSGWLATWEPKAPMRVG